MAKRPRLSFLPVRCNHKLRRDSCFHKANGYEGTKGLEKIATTDYTQQLPPGPAIRMAIRTEIAPAHPAPIGTVRVRAEVR
jgi:hypothetical protein